MCIRDRSLKEKPKKFNPNWMKDLEVHEAKASFDEVLSAFRSDMQNCIDNVAETRKTLLCADVDDAQEDPEMVLKFKVYLNLIDNKMQWVHALSDKDNLPK